MDDSELIDSILSQPKQEKEVVEIDKTSINQNIDDAQLIDNILEANTPSQPGLIERAASKIKDFFTPKVKEEVDNTIALTKTDPDVLVYNEVFPTLSESQKIRASKETDPDKHKEAVFEFARENENLKKTLSQEAEPFKQVAVETVKQAPSALADIGRGIYEAGKAGVKAIKEKFSPSPDVPFTPEEQKIADSIQGITDHKELRKIVDELKKTSDVTNKALADYKAANQNATQEEIAKAHKDIINKIDQPMQDIGDDFISAVNPFIFAGYQYLKGVGAVKSGEATPQEAGRQVAGNLEGYWLLYGTGKLANEKLIKPIIKKLKGTDLAIPMQTIDENGMPITLSKDEYVHLFNKVNTGKATIDEAEILANINNAIDKQYGKSITQAFKDNNNAITVKVPLHKKLVNEIKVSEPAKIEQSNKLAEEIFTKENPMQEQVVPQPKTETPIIPQTSNSAAIKMAIQLHQTPNSYKEIIGENQKKNTQIKEKESLVYADMGNIRNKIDKSYVKTYGFKQSIDNAFIHGGVTEEGQRLINKDPDGINKISLLATASKDILDRQDARAIINTLGNNVGDEYKTGYLLRIRNSLKSSGETKKLFENTIDNLLENEKFKTSIEHADNYTSEELPKTSVPEKQLVYADQQFPQEAPQESVIPEPKPIPNEQKNIYADVAKKDIREEQQKEIDDFYSKPVYEAESMAGIKIDKPQVIEKEAPKIIKRKDISINLAKKIRGAIIRSDARQVKKKASGAAGIYTPADEVARTTGMNDLTVVMHELTHYIDDALVDLKPTGKKEYDIEKNMLVEGRKTSSQTYTEAVAELLERYIVNPQLTESKYPKMTKYVTSKLKESNPEILAAIESAHREYVDWLSMTPEQRILSNASIGEKDIKKGDISTSILELTTNFLDRFAAIEDLEKKIGKGELKFEDRPYIAAWNIYSAGGKAETLMKFGEIIGPDGKRYKTNSYREILNTVGEKDMDKFRAYLLSRAVVVDKAITPIVTKDALIYLENLPTDLKAKFEKASNMLRDFNLTALKYYADAINAPELYEMLKEKYKAYVPLHRNMQEDKTIEQLYMDYSSRNLNMKRQPIKRRKGSMREIIDPLESIIKNTYQIIEEADRNWFKRKLVALTNKTPEGRRIIERIAPDKVRITAPEGYKFQKESSAVESAITGEEYQDIDAIFKISPFKPNGNLIEVKNGEHSEFYEVHDELLWKSLNGIGEDQLNMMNKILSAPARWLRAGIQTLEFALVTNPLRDNITAVINTKNGFIPIVDAISGALSVVRQDQEFIDWMASGGYNAFQVSMDRIGHQKKISEVMSKQVENWKTINPITQLQNVSMIFESATRLGEFKKAKQAGKEPIQAAWESKEITTNFAKHGLSIKSFENIVAFLRANTQGRYRLYKTARRNPVRVAFIVSTLMAATATNYLLMSDDDDYKEIPREMKDIYWFFKVGDARFKIPKPDIAQLFVNPVEYFFEWKDFNKKESGKMIAGMISAAIPGDIMRGGLWPNAVKPFVENHFNKSFFFGGQIVPESQLKVSPKYRELKNTSEITNWFTRLLPERFIIHPEQLQNIGRAYGGGLAGYFFKYTTMKELKDMKIEKLPFLKGFMWEIPEGMRTDTVQKVFTRAEEYQTYIDTFNYLKKQRKVSEANKYLRDHKKEITEAKKYNTVKNVILKRYKVGKLTDTDVDKDLLEMAKKYIKD